MSRDDDAWLEALAGHGGDSTEAREAAALRRAIRGRTVANADVAAESPAREAALLARARREGVLQPAIADTARNPPARPSWRRWLPMPLAMAALAAAIAVTMLTAPPPTEETVRGSSSPAVVLQSDDPAALRSALVEALLDAGADARGYAVFDDHVVEAALAAPLTDEVRSVLADFGLPVPEDGELLVHIRESTP
jgi:hypothetical protein